MTNTTVQPGVDSAPKGLIARAVGVITSPADTFRSVVARPRWLGMLALTTTVVAVAASAPMFTEAGREAALNQRVRQLESFGMTVSDEMYEQMRQGTSRLPYTTALSIMVGSPIIVLITSGILFVVFNVATGGDASFKQLFAVVVHAGVISALAQLYAAPINYVRGSVGGVSNLAALLPMIDDTSFFGRLLGMIDLFMIWYVIGLAIGLAVLYRRRTQPIALALFAVYAVIALGFAALMGGLGGSGVVAGALTGGSGGAS